QLKQILDLVRQHDLSEFEFEHEGLRLKLRRGDPGASVIAPGGTPVFVSASPHALAAEPSSAPVTTPVTASGPTSTGADDAVADEVEFAVVKSPIVGTFYRAPEPSAASFVEIGTMVKKGQVLCIIEAMKLMNEIDSEYDGEIVNVYVENGQPVQYGERLFAIRTA